MSTDLIAGRKPVFEAVEKRHNIDRVYLEEKVRGDYEKNLRAACKEANIALKVVPSYFFKPYQKLNHQGVIAEISKVRYVDPGQLIEHTFASGRVPLFLWLDKITDVRNFGAIARSALAFGVDGIFFPLKNSAPVNEVAIKTSAGALLDIPLSRFSNQKELALFLRDSGIMIWATSLKADSKGIMDIDLSVPSCLVIGSEEKGVNTELLELSYGHFRIPQSEAIDSLNASVAAAICLYEVYRQRTP